MKTISTTSSTRPQPVIPDAIADKASAISFIYWVWRGAKALGEDGGKIESDMREACLDTAEMLVELAGNAGQLNYWHHEHYEDQEAYRYSTWIGDVTKVADMLRAAEDPAEMLAAVKVLRAMYTNAQVSA
jgi:hypothetical protein